MPKLQRVPRIRASVRPPEEMTESMVETLMGLGRQEAVLIDEMEAAVRAGDRNLCWEIAQALVHIQDEVAQVTEAKEK